MVLLVMVVEGRGATEERGGSTGQEGVRLGEVGGGRKRMRRGETQRLTGVVLTEAVRPLCAFFTVTDHLTSPLTYHLRWYKVHQRK